MAEPIIKKALKYENYFINDSRMRRLYDMREDGIRDYVSGINEAKRDEAIAIAKKLLKLNVDTETICNATGLTIEQIDNL